MYYVYKMCAFYSACICVGKALKGKADIAMIKVISTIFVHRPERVLYYLPNAAEETAQYIADGVCPQQLREYQYSFGTYDRAGVFFLPENLRQTDEEYVIGIEYRKDDPAVNPPAHLPCAVLPACDIIIQDVAYEGQLSSSLLNEIISYARENKNQRSEQYSYVEDGMVVAFCAREKLRILYEVNLLNSPKLVSNEGCDAYSKEELFYRAFHEPITGYNNWSWMWEILNTYHLRGITDYGFVHFDVKDFKMINELYGHHEGNQVLSRIADNIKAHSDWVYCGARCHNDNFSMMIRDMPEEETRSRLISFFEEISCFDFDPSYKIFYRCGVVSMRNAMNAGDVVADCAKLAQAAGTDINSTEINFYTNDMHENIIWGKQLKAYLSTAVRNNEFVVHLQPKFNISDDERICGAEALVRWNYKNRELMLPYKFIPYFESDGSVIKVDEAVLCIVCAALRRWKENGLLLYPVSVNLSRKHLEQPGLVEHLAEIVDSYGVEHSLIEFELTESLAYDNQDYLVSVMNDLKNKGFMISLDDFGTGYSSFGLLTEMPLDTLKIDKCFVDRISEGKSAAGIKIILRHIISMAKELGVSCIAEGAEDYDQIAALRELGCEIVQGYYYSKPVTMDYFEEKYLR